MIYILLPTIIAKGVRTGIDYRGAALLAAGLGSLLLGFSWGGTQYPWGSWQIIGLLSTAAVLIGLFIRNEARHHDPIIPLDIFKNSIFRVSSIMLFLVGIAMFGAIIFLPLFAQTVQGASATNSGIILLPMVLSLTITSVVSGQITSRLGTYKKMAIFGTFVTTGALFWFATLSATSSYADLIIRMIPLGIGIGIMMPLFNLIVQNAFPQKLLGVVSSSVQLFRGVGSTIGVALMGTLLNFTLTKQITSLSGNNFAEQLQNHGIKLDANTLQQILSADGKQQAMAQIAKLPEATQVGATQAYNAFVSGGQHAIAVAVSHVFLASGIVLVIACVAVFFLKEIPLRRTIEHPVQSES